MKHIDRKISRQKFVQLFFVPLLILIFLSSCNGVGAMPTDPIASPTPYPSEVEWETAVEILNTGDVEMVTQFHSLDVLLTMKDGTKTKTVEPSIDDIFQEIEKCGQPCSDILIATE
jgi:hypothetical protein